MKVDSKQLMLDHEEFLIALVRGMAAKLPHFVEFDELLAFGRLGLVEAATRFQPDNGAAFQTFAYYRIRGAVFDGLRKMAGLRPIARTWVAAQETVDSLAQQIEAAPGGDARAALGAAARNIATVFIVSGVGVGDEIDSPAAAVMPVDEAAAWNELQSKLSDALRRLPSGDAWIVQRHFYDGVSLTEIARSLGVNKSTISRRLTSTLARLRGFLESEEDQIEPAHSSAMVATSAGSMR